MNVFIALLLAIAVVKITETFIRSNSIHLASRVRAQEKSIARYKQILQERDA